MASGGHVVDHIAVELTRRSKAKITDITRVIKDSQMAIALNEVTDFGRRSANSSSST
ncbi:MAG: hypothetical protein K2Y56_15940 [Methylobacterium sp.]|uniref:hypothetical protein n=1 Tax=Methylobacterium sp. TaxID=409 RepID=UPI0025E8928E|nr:hypothetical protein [Methylobacterium sp.]MBX9933006.1 hypothetical protein [Methylobacterium sp.]